MGITSIPAYMYFGTTNRQIDIQFHEDDFLLTYFRNKFGYTSGNVLWEASNIHETDLLAYCNKCIGDLVGGQNNKPIFARNYKLYAKLDEDNPELPSNIFLKLMGLSGFDHTTFNISFGVTKVQCLNGFECALTHPTYIGIVSDLSGSWANCNPGSGNTSMSGSIVSNYGTITIRYRIWPEGIFTPEGINIDYPQSLYPIDFSISARTNEDITEITYVRIRVDTRALGGLSELKYNVFTNGGNEFNTINSGINEQDTQNPYSLDGNSGMGGGDGKYNLDSDGTTDVPELPDIDAADLGFVTMYSPTKSQLKSLADFMWSNAFDLNTYKKLFADPMESIIGLAIVPVSPDIGGSKNVMFGTIDSGVNMNYMTSQYKKVDCGSVDIDKYVGSFLDYDYTKISIYLPYIGFRELDSDDVMGHTISVEYNVDCLSGACAAFISVSGRGVLYSYNGSCISNIPLTANNFSGAIQNAVSAIISGAGAVAGAVTGAAPLTAMGVSGLLNSAANTALNAKPAIQRSGNLGGSAGILSVQHPFVVIQRPDVSVPANIQNYVGQCCNITMSLANCKGFTMVDYIHLHDVACTSDELKEIEALLKEGVIL